MAGCLTSVCGCLAAIQTATLYQDVPVRGIITAVQLGSAPEQAGTLDLLRCLTCVLCLCCQHDLPKHFPIATIAWSSSLLPCGCWQPLIRVAWVLGDLKTLHQAQLLGLLSKQQQLLGGGGMGWL